MSLKLFLVSRDEGASYDEYDSFIVVSSNPYDAKRYHPSGDLVWDDAENKWTHQTDPEPWNYSWPTIPSALDVIEIGDARPHLTEGQILLASFNAG